MIVNKQSQIAGGMSSRHYKRSPARGAVVDASFHSPLRLNARGEIIQITFCMNTSVECSQNKFCSVPAKCPGIIIPESFCSLLSPCHVHLRQFISRRNLYSFRSWQFQLNSVSIDIPNLQRLRRRLVYNQQVPSINAKVKCSGNINETFLSA